MAPWGVSRCLALACMLMPWAASESRSAIVVETTRSFSQSITCLTLDTSGVSPNTLLVGLEADTLLGSSLFTLDPLTLDVLDTIYRSDHAPVICAVADINSDGVKDYLIGIGSHRNDSVSYHGLVRLYGPSYQLADTVVLGRPLNDIEVDQAQGILWFGSLYDSTFYGTNPLIIDYSTRYVGQYGYTPISTWSPVYLDDGRHGGADVVLCDVNGDGVRDAVCYWHAIEKWVCSCQMGSDWSGAGLDVVDGVSQLRAFMTLKSWGYVQHRDQYFYGMVSHSRLPILDANGDGSPEGVYSWAAKKEPVSWRNGIAVVNLGSGDTIWRHDTLPYTGLRASTPIVYDIDKDGLPDVLVSVSARRNGEYQWDLRGYRGSDGQLLFTTAFVPVHSLYAVQSKASVSESVIHATDNVLYRWHVDLSAGLNDPALPDRFELLHNYPNPFNSGTTIEFLLHAPGDVSLEVFNLLGHRIAVMQTESLMAGRSLIRWDGTDDQGMSVPSGVYLYRLSVGDQSRSRKMLLLR